MATYTHTLDWDQTSSKEFYTSLYHINFTISGEGTYTLYYKINYYAYRSDKTRTFKIGPAYLYAYFDKDLPSRYSLAIVNSGLKLVPAGFSTSPDVSGTIYPKTYTYTVSGVVYHDLVDDISSSSSSPTNLMQLGSSCSLDASSIARTASETFSGLYFAIFYWDPLVGRVLQSGTKTSVDSLTIKFYANAAPKYTMKWLKGDCDGVAGTKTGILYSDTFTHNDIYKNPTTGNGHNYTIEWDATGGIDPSDTSAKAPTTLTYDNFYWKSDWYGDTYEPKQDDQAWGNDQFSAHYKTADESITGTATLGSLPKTSRYGYTFSNWWTSASGGDQVASGLVIDSDKTFYAHWAARSYAVKMLKGSDNETSAFPDYTFIDNSNTKTYDTNSTLSSFQTTPTKFGYNFTGWSLTKGGDASISDGATITDANLGVTQSLQPNFVTSVNIYTAWTPKILTCTFNYYNPSSLSSLSFDVNYNIRDGFKSQFAPTLDPGANYAFLGWTILTTDAQISEWKACHGTYTSLSKIPSYVSTSMPYKIDTTKITNWDGYDISINPRNVYGVWVQTGKFVRIDDTSTGWKKVAAAYVKTSNGWKAIDRAAVYTDSGWKLEKQN